jgi:hypothetical protein
MFAQYVDDSLFCRHITVRAPLAGVLSAEVTLLDPPKPPSPAAEKGKKRAKATRTTVGAGSSGWTRTSNSPVNGLAQV